MPRINGSFDFFFATGGTPAAGGAGTRCAAGTGALFAGGGVGGREGVAGTCALAGGGGVDAAGPAGACGGGVAAAGPPGAGDCGCDILEDVGNPVGPVCFGKTTVGAEAAMVSFQSGGGLLPGCSPGGAVGTPMFAEL